MKLVFLNPCNLVLSSVLMLAPVFVSTAARGQDKSRLLPTTQLNKEKTALDRYVAAPDDSYAWKLVNKKEDEKATTYVIDLTSQTWLKPEEVDRTVWKHWLTIVKPKAATANTAMMFIGGGANGRAAPENADAQTMQLALMTNSVVAALGQVPNQPLVFHGDGQKRTEDDLIGYTWDQYLKTGDDRWPARLPMTKSVVRAMDAVQEFLKSEEGGKFAIEHFVVAGGSKRGWTTWCVGAVDKRVAAIAPIVIDVLNVNQSMKNHYSAYGFWAPAVGDYLNHQLFQRRYHPRNSELMQIEDPFAYRDRFTMPKCIINACGDQFFCPDSSQFYFDELPGEKSLCYVPNGDHSLKGTNALETLAAFHYSVVNKIKRPEFSWTFPDENTIRVTTKEKPNRVLLWSAVNPTARDFRVDTIGKGYTSVELAGDGDGVYVGAVSKPEKGWMAYVVQLEFDIGAPTPIRLTTPTRVTPDVLPFSSKEAPVID
jgi:PhoPQ-activated pathogenicity-related protein